LPSTTCDLFADRFSPRSVLRINTRAEPVAALYEQGRVHHVGTFGTLEDQLCTPRTGRSGSDLLDDVATSW
jgi:phage terminase large subunit-like protein